MYCGSILTIISVDNGNIGFILLSIILFPFIDWIAGFESKTMNISFPFLFLVAIDGFGTKRLFGIYIGMNQNLSKLSKLISSIVIDWFSLILASHSSSSSLLSFLIAEHFW